MCVRTADLEISSFVSMQQMHDGAHMLRELIHSCERAVTHMAYSSHVVHALHAYAAVYTLALSTSEQML